jgi:hypothetical protein
MACGLAGPSADAGIDIFGTRLKFIDADGAALGDDENEAAVGDDAGSKVAPFAAEGEVAAAPL